MSKLTDAGRADEVSQKAKAPKEQFSVGLFLGHRANRSVTVI